MSQAKQPPTIPQITETLKSVTIVVPTYKEAENIPNLVRRIAKVMDGAYPDYEILIVDDDSQDGTEQCVARLVDDSVPVRLITRTNERGLSSAVLRGFEEAKGDVLLCMDADLSHPPEEIPNLIATVSPDDVDFVIGSRYVEGGQTDAEWGLFRWINSKVATMLARPFTTAKDPMAGFFAVSRDVFRRGGDSLNPVGYKIALELIVKCGVRNVREVPISFADRQHGESKLNLREQVNYLRHLKRLADFRYGFLSRLVQFCFVGATGMVIDLAFYASLLALLPLSLLPVSRILAIWVAMTWNFWLNRKVTFSDRRQKRVVLQYGRFAASCAVGMALSWSTAMALTYGTDWFAERLLLAAVLGIIAGTLANFTLSLVWVFGKQKKKPVASSD